MWRYNVKSSNFPVAPVLSDRDEDLEEEDDFDIQLLNFLMF